MKWMKNENKCEIQSRFGKNEKYKKCVYMRINKLWSELHLSLELWARGVYSYIENNSIYIYNISVFNFTFLLNKELY